MIVKLLSPSVWGVAVIAPVLMLSANPSGKVPVVMDHKYDSVPPLPTNVVL